jgi:hypothetical protein
MNDVKNKRERTRKTKKFKLAAIQPAESGGVTLEYDVDARFTLVTVCWSDFVIDEDGEQVKGPLAKHAISMVQGIYEQWRQWITPPSVPFHPASIPPKGGTEAV